MSATFMMTRNQIIQKAYRKAGVVGEGEDMTAGMLNEAADDLNLIIKGLERYRRKLWALEDLQQAIDVPDCVNYGGNSYACQITHTSSTDHLPGTDEYWVLIDEDTSLDDYADATAYTGSSFLVDASTTAIERARYTESIRSYPLDMMNRFEDNQVAERTTQSTPEGLYFDRPNSRVYLYPVPNRALTLEFTRIRLLDDLVTAGGFPDVPVTLLSYLIYELAAEIAEEYDREEQKIARLRNKAQGELALAIRNQKEYTDNDTIEPAY
jgi:hypothetical protein